MPQIAIVGAGSRVFAEAMIRDTLTFPALADSTFRLMDIDPEPLGYMETIATKIIAQGDYPAKVVATTDLREALDGADYVIVSILSNGREPIYWEIDIPLKHGVDQCIADTMGPGGIFRAMRTIPQMVEIAFMMEEVCPDALMLNYTNPMSMLCHAVRELSDVSVVGLCHSVQGLQEKLPKEIGEDPADCQCWVAGINHTAWCLDFTCKGEDAYPRLKEVARTKTEWYENDTTRVEMLRQLGHYVTESSGHNSEYNPWFRKRADLVEKYAGETWNGATGFIKDLYSADRNEYMSKMREYAEQDEPYKLERGHEYGSRIMNAIETNEPFCFNGTVANNGYITNLPDGCSVEVPIYADASGLNPTFVGDLPMQLAALNGMQTQSLVMAVEACLAGDREMLFHSIAYDPLTAARLSLAEIRAMVDEMYEKEKHLMPTFTAQEQCDCGCEG
jgi:alpha-galactosidase